ncbi:hypothetical protein D9615_002156 [Tricholomella constricta]|uniref:F-box domain-containing protein n=1 Tax=Tricholomella constricta TaxID=117010 RepID=A0A8H5MAW8_9AGAR|nr:hypothetical protein D9615_002156 [Tricholomella constricta]
MAKLPTELLTSIFTYAYTDSRWTSSSKHESCPRLEQVLRESIRCTCMKDEMSYTPKWKSYELYSPTLFPYPLAAVCRQWRDVLEDVPVFWTRVVALIDRRPTDLSRLQKQLQLSKDQPLDVFVLRRPDAYEDSDPREHDRCRSVINALMPHLQRCRSISFDVIDTSSLPSISHDFRGSAPLLTSLTLNARKDDGKASGDWNSVSMPQSIENPFKCPNLTSIDIDGRNFVYACLDLPSWRDSLQSIPGKTGLSRLTLSNFSPGSAEKDYELTGNDILEILMALRLSFLSFNNVDFSSDVLSLGIPQINAISLSATGLRASFMTLLLHGLSYHSPASIHIERCELVDAVAPFSHCLSLTDISAEVDMESFLDHWGGYVLHVLRCPAFNDWVLCSYRPDPSRPFWLNIEDCEAFTVAGLRALVQMIREEQPMENVTYEVRVSGWGPRAPTDAEMEWFETHLDRFRWDAKERHEKMLLP